MVSSNNLMRMRMVTIHSHFYTRRACSWLVHNICTHTSTSIHISRPAGLSQSVTHTNWNMLAIISCFPSPCNLQ